MATSLNQTTLSGAITASQTTIPVASATNISAPIANISQQIYVIGPGQPRGELMTVTSVSGTQIGVSRLDEYKAFWPSGSLVLIGPTSVVGANFAGSVLGGFQTFNPPGASASKEKASRRPRPSSSGSSRRESPLMLTPACTATVLCCSTDAGTPKGGGSGAVPGGQPGYRW